MTKTQGKEVKKQEETKSFNLDELITNSGSIKYKKLVLAMQWVYHLKTTEEYKNKPTTEIIEQAMKDIFSGRITEKEVLSAMKKDEEDKQKKLEEKKKKKTSK